MLCFCNSELLFDLNDISNFIESCNIWISLSITDEVPLTWWAIDTDPHQSAWERGKKKHIWVTYLHNNVAPSMKQLRFGASGGQRCTCAPSSLREPFILFIYLCICALPVNSGRSVNVVGRQLYAFHQCCWHWPAQHRQAGLKRAGVSTSLNPAYSRWIFTQPPSPQNWMHISLLVIKF